MPTEAECIARTEELLRAESTLALATTDGAGTPCVAPVFYLCQSGLRLYWLSSPRSRHSRNLRLRPDAAATVYRATARWQEIRGVQMRGHAGLVRSRQERASIVAAYSEHFALGPLVRPLLVRASLYVFAPTWVRYLDNSVRLGYSCEFTLPAPGL